MNVYLLRLTGTNLYYTGGYRGIFSGIDEGDIGSAAKIYTRLVHAKGGHKAAVAALKLQFTGGNRELGEAYQEAGFKLPVTDDSVSIVRMSLKEEEVLPTPAKKKEKI